jgi:kynurenine formamidase
VPLDYLTPPLFGRGADRRTTLAPSNAGFDDVHDNFYPQAASQWDSLGHVAFAPDRFYNGRSAQEVRDGANTIDHWAARGIVTRAVVLDLEPALADRGGPGAAIGITPDELEAARTAAGVEVAPGDALVLHTGFLTWYGTQGQAARLRMSNREGLTSAGVEHSEAMAEYLWDLHVSAIVSDGPSVEMWPPDGRREAQPFGFLHHTLIGLFGMALGELWWLADLADDCRADGRYTMFLASAPLNVPGGVSSPANAVAFK